MTTIRAYTSLEQSNKLLELGLNPKSADLEYKCVGFTMHANRPTDNFKYKVMLKEQSIPHGQKYNIPCWSLAALLELLPKRLQIEDNVCELSVYLYGLYYWNITNGNPCFESKYKDNLVDACYEMIIRLHELNLL